MTSSFSDQKTAKKASKLDINGFRVLKGFLTRPEQQKIVVEISDLVRLSPLFKPCMPGTGKPFSVQMSNLGDYGWVSDKTGYRYQKTHPETGVKWPEIPTSLQAIWQRVADYELPAEACLVNYYDASAKMGLHRDEDEKNFSAPVVSISLGDTAVFRMGGATRKGPTSSIKLDSGDVVIIGGPARMFYHGVDRILGGSSSLLKNGGRLNLTLRRVR